MAEDKWYVRIRGRVAGPYSLLQLQSLRKRRQINRSHEISQDEKNWLPASELSELFPAIAREMKQKEPPVAASPRSPQSASSPKVEMPWYYSKGTEQFGPVSITELQRLVDAGGISADELVWQEGMASWVPARDIPNLVFPGSIASSTGSQTGIPPVQDFPGAADGVGNQRPHPQRKSYLQRGSTAIPPGIIWEVVIENVRQTVTTRQLQSMGRMMANLGNYGMIGGIILVPVYLTILGFRFDPVNGWLIAAGLLGSLLLTAFQFFNQRLLVAIEGQIESARMGVSTTGIFEALGIIFLGIAILLPGISIFLAVETKQYYLLVSGVAGFYLCGLLGRISMQTDFLNIHFDKQATAADDCLAMYAFLIKLGAAIIPHLYGVTVIGGCIGLVVGTLQISMEAEALWVTAVHEKGLGLFCFALVLPIFGYLNGLLPLLIVFILQAILMLPRKLGELKDSSQNVDSK